MEIIDTQVIRSICFWPDYQFSLCPSMGASGGVLLLWNATLWHKLDEFLGRFSVSILLQDFQCDAVWVATLVYGPNNASDRGGILGRA